MSPHWAPAQQRTVEVTLRCVRGTSPDLGRGHSRRAVSLAKSWRG